MERNTSESLGFSVRIRSHLETVNGSLTETERNALFFFFFCVFFVFFFFFFQQNDVEWPLNEKQRLLCYLVSQVIKNPSMGYFEKKRKTGYGLISPQSKWGTYNVG